jgi:uroporphyrinogen-III decarboxylase
VNSKERMMCAINGEKPDRMPVTVHQWQGYHLDTYMDGITPLEAFKKVGMDAAIQYFADMGQFWLVDADFAKFSTSDWKDEVTVISNDPENRINHHRIVTPGGDLSYKTAGNRKTTWITEYLIKRDEDLELIRKYMPVPMLDKKPLEKVYNEVGDSGIIRGFVWGDQAGCWQHAACLTDINDLIIRSMTDPGWVHRLLEILLQKKLDFVNSMKGAKFDLVETGGGSSSSTLVSPDLHREFCLPYDRKLHDALHSAGFKITYHTCGGTYGIEEYIIANGTDCSETLAPKSIGGNQEPWEVKEKVGNRISLIGGIDQYNVLTDGPGDKIKSMVHTLFEKVGYDGGYICACSDHFFETPVEHIKIMADAAKDCIY